MTIPTVTTEEMREVDRLMTEEFGIHLVQMMENAGRALAELARKMLAGNLKKSSIVVLCGAGNNGGGGMVAGRHLHNWGAEVSVVLAGKTTQLKAVPIKQWTIINKLEIAYDAVTLDGHDLIVDALLGYGARGDPRPPISNWIEEANQSGTQVLSLDTPSGLDTTSGVPGTPCMRANATLTLALPKTGLFNELAKAYVGDLYLADISVPPQLYQRIGLDFEADGLFAEYSVVRVHLEK